MASDVFGNEVGKMAVINAAEGEITCSGGGRGKALGINVTYNVPVQQVLTFGKDVIFAKGTPSGNFSLAWMAGTGIIKNKGGCKPSGITITLNRKNCSTGISDFDKGMGTHSIGLAGVVWGSYQIQGRAEDYYFTNNVGGWFHYLEKVS